MFASLSDASNEVLVRGADSAFLVADVDTLPGDGSVSGGALTMRLTCSKGRLTFGFLLRGGVGGSGWGGAGMSQGGEEGYSGGGGGEGLRSLNGLVFTEGDGVDDDAFTVLGSARDLNEALRDLRYRGKPGEQVLLCCFLIYYYYYYYHYLQLDRFIFLALEYKCIGLGCDQREPVGLASRCLP